MASKIGKRTAIRIVMATIGTAILTSILLYITQEITRIHPSIIAFCSVFLSGFIIYPMAIKFFGEYEITSKHLLEAHISMVEAVGRAIAKRDSDTGIHNYRVAWIAARIAEKMNYSGKEMQAIMAGSFLHDVGKIAIHDYILLKPGKLTEEEFNIMKTHVQQGAEIVSGMDFLEESKKIVEFHHERWDGKGYPHGLWGSNIPLEARIFAVADVFDALSSKRPYKESLPFEEVMKIIDNETGTHFDPQVIGIFRPMARQIYLQLAQCDENQAKRLLEEKVRDHFGL